MTLFQDYTIYHAPSATHLMIPSLVGGVIVVLYVIIFMDLMVKRMRHKDIFTDQQV